MKESKLLGVLATLNRQEWKQFDLFLDSPYFNGNKDLLSLGRLLNKEAPQFKAEKVDRYLLWRKLYPKRATEEKELKYLMSHLLKKVEQFLGQQMYENRPFLGTFHVTEACSNRNLEKHYRNNLKKLERERQKHPFQAENYFYHLFQVSGLATQYSRIQQVRVYDHHLQEMVNYLDDYYLITKLRLTCELINRQNILSASYDIRLVDELLGYLKYYDYEQVPAMNIYYQILCLLTSENSSLHFMQLKELIVMHSHVFRDEEKQEVYSYAQNYCIQMIKKGGKTFQKELFDLYCTGLETSILVVNGILSPWKFKNIVSVGLGLGEFSWVESFMEEYKGNLPEDFAETALLYNKANLHYHQGNFKSALRSLRDVEFSDVFYSLDTRKMVMKIYYEEEDLEPLASLIASFGLYLRRNTLVSDAVRLAYSNFIQLVNQLIRKKEGKSLRDLEAEIEKTQPLVEEEWLQLMAKRMG